MKIKTVLRLKIVSQAGEWGNLRSRSIKSVNKNDFCWHFATPREDGKEENGQVSVGLAGGGGWGEEKNVMKSDDVMKTIKNIYRRDTLWAFLNVSRPVIHKIDNLELWWPVGQRTATETYIF